MSDHDGSIEISKCWSKLYSLELKIIELQKSLSTMAEKIAVLEKLPLRSYTKEESDCIFMSKMDAEEMKRDLDRRRDRR